MLSTSGYYNFSDEKKTYALPVLDGMYDVQYGWVCVLMILRVYKWVNIQINRIYMN